MIMPKIHSERERERGREGGGGDTDLSWDGLEKVEL
jgi:hypothetical protein